ncbi:sugar phosphate isomerase/epimerase family protein [Laceyella putida]|uniref:Sugar phosphate isomerase/epimerase family protein n=1 Tax=Laceyella putida TaxID=110101 RepID=A0ABW2RPX7_9BACL
MSFIALQLWSLNSLTKDDFLGTLRKVGEMGYDGVEFAGYYDTPAKVVKEVLAESKLQVVGSHIPLDLLQEDQLEATLAYQEEIGNRFVVCPWLPEEKRQTVDAYKRTAEEFNKIGEACRKAGFQFAYHNHDFEFASFGDKTGFEILFDETDFNLVKMELDVYWAYYAGWDPVALISRYGDALGALHIKDLKTDGNKKYSTEVGSGEIDMAPIKEAGNKLGLNWFIVEQEYFTIDPLEAAKTSLDYLKKI